LETSFQNLFDSLSWALTIIWSNPASFQWPVVISIAAVYAAGGLYTYFLRQRRGHILHSPHCLVGK
jgi:iron-regulated transporter 1